MDEPTGITTLRLTDAARFGDVLVLVHDAFRGFEPPSSVLSETIADIEQRFKAGPLLIAQVGDELVGSIFCAVKDDALYLTRLATLPAWCRRGVGRALMAAAEAQARANGAKRLTLRVRITLPANQRYFERLGFIVTREGQEGGRTPFLRWSGGSPARAAFDLPQCRPPSPAVKWIDLIPGRMATDGAKQEKRVTPPHLSRPRTGPDRRRYWSVIDRR